jgi:hypothetical protein
MTAICEYPDGVILKTCANQFDMHEIGEGLTSLIGDMKEACISFHGQGLTANQIGVLKRVIIFQDSQGQFQSLTNPEITELGSETATAAEGCLEPAGPASQGHSADRDHRHWIDRGLSTDHDGRRRSGSAQSSSTRSTISMAS